jgi:serine/threonine protein phosphatase PrpC
MGYRIQGQPGPADASAPPACELAARRLSNDHKPEAPAERARIEATGGRVCPFELRGKAMGPPRVWRGDEWTPGLAVARSFGDSVAATIGVSAVPEVRSYELGPDVEFLVLGSDGVWDLIADDEAVRIVTAACARGQTPQEASAELVRTALDALQNARRKDNATALVITIALARPPQA